VALLKKRWLYFILPLLALTVAFSALRNSAPIQYMTAPVRYGDIEQTVLATGTLSAINQVSVGAQVSGQLKSLKVALGEQVKKRSTRGRNRPDLAAIYAASGTG
jgi:macrolide-specific efflux system membrane fusion protein